MDEAKKRVLDHYKNPRNQNELVEHTHLGESKNLSCGDEVSIKLDVVENEIQNIQVTSEGCSICIGSASILSERIKHGGFEEALAITKEEVLEDLGLELNQVRTKCALLALDALKNSVNSTANSVVR